jgi:hypothetical protein
MKLVARSFLISSPIALRLSSLKRRSHCFTGLEPCLMFKECSVTFLGMPGMSEGLHTKTLMFTRR